MSEAELNEYKQQLELVEEGLKADPTDKSLAELKTELVDLIQLLEGEKEDPEADQLDNKHENHSDSPKIQINTKESQNSSIQSSLDVNKEPNKDSNDKPIEGPKERSPSVEPAPPPRARSNNTGATTKNLHLTPGTAVLAQMIHGDKQFHPAKITVVAGSQNDPVYTVQFIKQPGTIETLRSHQLKKLAPEPSLLSSQPPKPIHQPVSKAKLLDQNKNSWQQFNQKGKAKALRTKKSIFSTPAAPYTVDHNKDKNKNKIRSLQRPRQRPVFEKLDD